jgi:hypothetical protein
MPSNAHALPRARRRKIRPPHPLWFVAVAFVAEALLLLGLTIAHVARLDLTLHAAVAVVSASIAVQVWWPVIRRPYKPLMPSPTSVLLVAFLGSATIATSIAGL